MNNKARKVKISTIFNILKKRPLSMRFGFMFTILPLILIIPISIVFSTLLNDSPNIDYDLINTKGEKKSAIITNIETQYNETINEVHPTIISYKYSENGKEIEFSYKVLEERKIEQLKIDDKVEIKVFDEKSIVIGLKPSNFPIWIVFIMPSIFLIIGLPFLVYSITNLKKELKLYKFGKVSKGKIVSMIPKPRFGISNIGQGVIVHYELVLKNGTKTIVESSTTDFSIIGDKKNGDFIPIFVSPKDDRVSCIVPKLDSFRNNWNIDFE